MIVRVSTASLLLSVLLAGSTSALLAGPAEAKNGGGGGGNNYHGGRHNRNGGGFGQIGGGGFNQTGQLGRNGGRLTDFMARNGMTGTTMRDALASGQLASLVESGNLSAQDQNFAQKLLNRYNRRNSLNGGVGNYLGSGNGTGFGGWGSNGGGWGGNGGGGLLGSGLANAGFGNGNFPGGFPGGGMGMGNRNGNQPKGKAWGWYRNHGMSGMSGMPPGQARKMGY